MAELISWRRAWPRIRSRLETVSILDGARSLISFVLISLVLPVYRVMSGVGTGSGRLFLISALVGVALLAVAISVFLIRRRARALTNLSQHQRKIVQHALRVLELSRGGNSEGDSIEPPTLEGSVTVPEPDQRAQTMSAVDTTSVASWKALVFGVQALIAVNTLFVAMAAGILAAVLSIAPPSSSKEPISAIVPTRSPTPGVVYVTLTPSVSVALPEESPSTSPAPESEGGKARIFKRLEDERIILTRRSECSTPEWERGAVSIDGRDFFNGLRVVGGCYWSEATMKASFVLGKGYRELKVLVGVADSARTTGPFEISVYKDAQERPILSKSVSTGHPLRVDLQTSSIVRLTVQASIPVGDRKGPTVALGTARVVAE